ncbi:hypothetical protein V5O48_005724 [Marasmius crinis-equi]|uniref:Uncharacterized protein n=1 Tax=Marasmius crinis-equi TaxID=585013 RepID=A0ABR3FLH9_9AGAR
MHHVFFSRLHLQSADRTRSIGQYQVSMQRISTLAANAFIFLSKLLFSLSISKAFDQRVWTSANKRFIKLQGLNALFSAITNPFAFISFEMAVKAKIATFMAAVAWLLPLALIPIPGALTVQPRNFSSIQDTNVPSVNLLEDPTNVAIALYNPLRFYNSPSTTIQALASKVLISNSISTWESPCGRSSSCSYNQTFFAPSFQCTSPNNLPLRGPESLLRWSASVEEGNDRDVLSVRWVSDFHNSTISATNCTSYNSTYDVSVRFRGGNPDIVVNSIEPGETFGTGTPENWTSPRASDGSSVLGGNPFGMWVGFFGTYLKSDSRFIQLGHAYLSAIRAAVTTILTGAVFVERQRGLSITNSTLVMLSPTLPVNLDEGGDTLSFRPDTHTIIENILTNTSISLLSLNLWNNTVPMLTESALNVFVYQPSVLWAGYGVCIGLTCAMILIGAYSGWMNGGSKDIKFSTIVKASRNQVLDRYTELTARDDRYTNRNFLNLKLRYGLIDVDVDEDVTKRRMAFGIETQLKTEDRAGPSYNC